MNKQTIRLYNKMLDMMDAGICSETQLARIRRRWLRCWARRMRQDGMYIEASVYQHASQVTPKGSKVALPQ